MTPLNLFAILLLPAFVCMAHLATPEFNHTIAPPIYHAGDLSSRSADTCADPSLARTIFEGFNGSLLAHILRFHWNMVDANTEESTGPPAWSFQGPVFKAWPSEQPFTVPLWQLTNPSFTEFIFLPGTDQQTPPVLSGFTANSIGVWVYNTSVCGSVPLMSAAFPAKSDHYYTTDPDEHGGLLAIPGWTDTGVVAFVLPLPSL